MARDATRILREWKNHLPDKVPKEDVLAVVAEFFPGEYAEKQSSSMSSHYLEVECAALHLAELEGQTSVPTLGGVLSISHVHGRWVHKGWIRKLVDAIAIKQEMESRFDADAIQMLIKKLKKGQGTAR